MIKLYKTNISYQRGMSLVELMVALIIGLVVSLAVYNVMSVQEARKRTTTSVNDIDQSGAYGLYILDKAIRSAGSGFTTAAQSAFGCRLNASLSAAQILPTGALPAPFGNILANSGGSIRLAPVVIVNGVGQNGSDALITMNGTAGLGESATEFSAVPTAPNNFITNVAGFTANDRLLLIDNSAALPRPCLMEQVANGFSRVAGSITLPLAGPYYTTSGADRVLAVYSASTTVVNLGADPSFSIFTTGINNSLYSYNLLVPNATANANPILDGVYGIHAIYGVKLTPTANLTWIDPASDANYSATNLLNGSVLAKDRLLTIKAIRVALVMRTSLPEKNLPNGAPVSSNTMTIFAGTTAAITIALNPTNIRYRLVETTIPIRNALLQ